MTACSAGAPVAGRIWLGAVKPGLAHVRKASVPPALQQDLYRVLLPDPNQAALIAAIEEAVTHKPATGGEDGVLYAMYPP